MSKAGATAPAIRPLLDKPNGLTQTLMTRFWAGDAVLGWASKRVALERFPTGWNHSVDKKSLYFQRSRACSHRNSLSTFSEHALAAWIMLVTAVDIYEGRPT
jgi:hypothetical protein